LCISTIVRNGLMATLWIGSNIDRQPLVTVGVGFGIDYGVYIVSRIIEEIRINGDLEESIHIALRTSGKAVSFTAVCMVAGTALWSLSNIRFNAVMGGLLAVWMFVSFVASVTLLPALISYLRPGFITKEALKGTRRPMTGMERAAVAVS